MSDRGDLIRFEAPLWIVVAQVYKTRSFLILAALTMTGTIGAHSILFGTASVGGFSLLGISLSLFFAFIAHARTWSREREQLITYLSERVPKLKTTDRYRRESRLLRQLLKDKHQREVVEHQKKADALLSQERRVDLSEISRKYSALDAKIDALITRSAVLEAEANAARLSPLLESIEQEEAARTLIDQQKQLALTEHAPAETSEAPPNKKDKKK